MRFFLHKEKCGEILLRQKYLYETFHIWFVVIGEIDRFIVMQAFPFDTEENIGIFYGHNYQILPFLSNRTNVVNEKNLFLITCEVADSSCYNISGKNIHIPIQYGRKIGATPNEFGFDFNITLPEVDLCNAPVNNILEKLLMVFVLVN